MSRSIAMNLIVGLAVAGGILLCSHFVRHAVNGIASAVWGS
jgi:hypothetical protein